MTPYEQGYMEKLAQAGAAAAIAERTPLQWVRTALGTGVAGGGGLATGYVRPGDPEHRGFSAQTQGLGSAAGGAAGLLGGYRLADMLRAGRKGIGPGALNLLLPLVTGTIGAGAGGMAGHAVAKARYEGNELWRWLTGQPQYEEVRSDRVKKSLMALAAMAGLAGAGAAGYSMYDRFKE